MQPSRGRRVPRRRATDERVDPEPPASQPPPPEPEQQPRARRVPRRRATDDKEETEQQQLPAEPEKPVRRRRLLEWTTAAERPIPQQLQPGATWMGATWRSWPSVQDISWRERQLWSLFDQRTKSSFDVEAVKRVLRKRTPQEMVPALVIAYNIESGTRIDGRDIPPGTRFVINDPLTNVDVKVVDISGARTCGLDGTRVISMETAFPYCLTRVRRDDSPQLIRGILVDFLSPASHESWTELWNMSAHETGHVCVFDRIGKTAVTIEGRMFRESTRGVQVLLGDGTMFAHHRSFELLYQKLVIDGRVRLHPIDVSNYPSLCNSLRFNSPISRLNGHAEGMQLTIDLLPPAHGHPIRTSLSEIGAELQRLHPGCGDPVSDFTCHLVDSGHAVVACEMANPNAHMVCALSIEAMLATPALSQAQHPNLRGAVRAHGIFSECDMGSPFAVTSVSSDGSVLLYGPGGVCRGHNVVSLYTLVTHDGFAFDISSALDKLGYYSGQDAVCCHWQDRILVKYPTTTGICIAFVCFERTTEELAQFGKFGTTNIHEDGFQLTTLTEVVGYACTGHDRFDNYVPIFVPKAFVAAGLSARQASNPAKPLAPTSDRATLSALADNCVRCQVVPATVACVDCGELRYCSDDCQVLHVAVRKPKAAENVCALCRRRAARTAK